MRVLDLFSGIGGFSLGLERTGGFRTVAFCEIDPYCRAVLRKRWPGVPVYPDVRELNGTDVAADLICGGFPCQDISIAGNKAGIEGARSGLWREFARLILEIRPRYALVENVARLTVSGLHNVLGDLAEIGYDAEWHCIPAAAVGAPHIRDRVWIIAYPNGERRRPGQHLVPNGRRFDHWQASEGKSQWQDLERWLRETFQNGDWGATDAALLGVDDGIPGRLDRLRALGNTVVPQVVELIGQAIIKAEEVNMKRPAAPLPWHFIAEVGQGAFIHANESDDVAALVVTGSNDRAAVQNGNYIEHACNAYPKLVEALRTVDPEHPLLTELGE